MPAYQNLRVLFILICLPFFLACGKPAAQSKNMNPETKTTEKDLPAWLQQKIAQFRQDKPANPPIKIYSYTYRDQQVYYITSRCCDIPSEVYTVQGQQWCQPDGGFTGKGDGKCPDFFQTRSEEKLIWEDLRK